MGELIKSIDQSRTSPGPPDNWPESLRTTLLLCLAPTFRCASSCLRSPHVLAFEPGARWFTEALLSACLDGAPGPRTLRERGYPTSSMGAGSGGFWFAACSPASRGW